MANLLKKIEVGNPLINLGLHPLFEDYESVRTDEELVKVYHHILNSVEGSELAENLVYSMIAYSTSMDVNPVYFLMQQTIRQK